MAFDRTPSFHRGDENCVALSPTEATRAALSCCTSQVGHTACGLRSLTPAEPELSFPLDCLCGAHRCGTCASIDDLGKDAQSAVFAKQQRWYLALPGAVRQHLKDCHGAVQCSGSPGRRGSLSGISLPRMGACPLAHSRAPVLGSDSSFREKGPCSSDKPPQSKSPP